MKPPTRAQVLADVKDAGAPATRIRPAVRATDPNAGTGVLPVALTPSAPPVRAGADTVVGAQVSRVEAPSSRVGTLMDKFYGPGAKPVTRFSAVRSKALQL